MTALLRIWARLRSWWRRPDVDYVSTTWLHEWRQSQRDERRFP